MLIHLSTNSPLTLFTGLCCPRFLFHICFTLLIFVFLVNCAKGNMHTQFKFKHTVSIISGQKKLHFTHRVHPVGINRYIRGTGFPILPCLGDLKRMKGWSQSKKNTQLWMWLVIEARSDAVKSSIAYEPGMSGPLIKANWKWSNKRWQEWMSTF